MSALFDSSLTRELALITRDDIWYELWASCSLPKFGIRGEITERSV